MKLLIIFFSAVLSVSSTDIGYLEDYPEALNCFQNAPRQRNEFPLSQELLENGQRFITNCIENVAKSDSKVGQLKEEMTSIILQTYKFKQVDYYICGAKIKSLPISECYESTGRKPGDSFCNEEFGKDGCMLQVYEQTCGKEYVKQLRNLVSYSREYHVCLE